MSILCGFSNAVFRPKTSSDLTPVTSQLDYRVKFLQAAPMYMDEWGARPDAAAGQPIVITKDRRLTD